MSETIDDYGIWVENRVRTVAARAGVPDFVYKPIIVRKGESSREVGDSLIWIGHQLVIVSVKSRSLETSEDTPERRNSWLKKNVQNAIKQINGTYRTLHTRTDLIMKSERDVEVPWNRKMVTEVTGVVVVDHNDPWEFKPDVSSAVVPTVVFATDDWDALHEQYCSTAAFVGYLAWRARNGLPRLSLDAEKDVIASLHIAETDLPIGSPVEVTPGAWDRAWLERPEIFFGSNPERNYARIVDGMIAGAADLDPELTLLSNPTDYLKVIEFLDRIPLFPRIDFGKAVVEKCKKAGISGEISRMIVPLPHGVIIFVSDPDERKSRSRAMQSLTAARHTQMIEATGIGDLTTLGIATEPWPTEGRSHDFFLIQATVNLTDEEKQERDDLFGPLPVEFHQLLMSRYRGAASTMSPIAVP